MRMVTCSKLKKELEGLERPTYPGELGKKVFDSVSKEAWALWLKHMTMLINEYRLTPIEPKARTFLEEEMEKFFFGEGSETPKDFKPEWYYSLLYGTILKIIWGKVKQARIIKINFITVSLMDIS